MALLATDIRCSPPSGGDTDLGIANISVPCASEVNICEKCFSTNPLPYFIGATRTYIFYSKWFTSDWIHPSPTPSDIIASEVATFEGQAGYTGPVLNEACWSTQAIYNKVLIAHGVLPPPQSENSGGIIRELADGPVVRGEDDALIHEYYYSMLTEQINEHTDALIKWVDDDIISWIAPLFLLVAWLTGCGEPCYPCVYEDIKCKGAGFLQTQTFKTAVTNYWFDIYNTKGLFPYEGFVTDYYGRIIVQPEPVIGWQLYFIEQCNYCHCILFCILRQCRDPWYTITSFSSKIFLLNRFTGIPYRFPAKLIEFGKRVQEDTGLGTAPIMLDHISDEYVWAHGYSNLYDGTIYNAIDKSKDGEIKTQLLGEIIEDFAEENGYTSEIAGYYTNQKGFKEATFTKATGGKTEDKKDAAYRLSYYDLVSKGAAYASQQSTVPSPPTEKDTPPLDNFPEYVYELAVKYKHSGNITGQNLHKMLSAGWLYVDIPEVVEPYVKRVGFSADWGTLPYVKTNYDMGGVWGPFVDDKQFFTRSVWNNGFMVQVDDISEPPEGIDQFECKYFPQVYAKKFSLKSVKAPYNLFFKSGEAKFNECKLFETLSGLPGGRYFFPNPYICRNTILNWYDFNVIGGKAGEHYDIDETEGEVYKYFNTELPMQFLGRKGDIPRDDLKRRLFQAVRVLGFPWDKAVGASGAYNNIYPLEDLMVRNNRPSFTQAAYDAISSGCTDPNNATNLMISVNDFFRDLYLAGYTEYMPQ